jgi:L-threonylcarbamoyladenylate synthase
MISTDCSKAVELLKTGEIVALPTETVYGLAGNALNPAAIAKIFAAKNRPQDNPLIVHICDIYEINELGLQLPDLAVKLANKFWAGSLTIVLKKIADIVPPEISCGLGSVAVRMPDSPIMLDIIKRCGFPLAAPSANLSGSPSPTRARHVSDDLAGRIPLIIDGGDCSVGIESTVIAFDGNNNDKIRILRPGAVTFEQLRQFADVEIADSCNSRNNCAPLSPGMKYKHYSPKAKVVVFAVNVPDGAEYVIDSPQMQTLYAQLRQFDKIGADKIYIRLPEKSGTGLALYNRIIRAAGLEK